MGGEWQITFEVFRDLGWRLRWCWVTDLCADGGLVRILPYAGDRDGRHSLFVVGILPAHGALGAFFTATR